MTTGAEMAMAAIMEMKKSLICLIFLPLTLRGEQNQSEKLGRGSDARRYSLSPDPKPQKGPGKLERTRPACRALKPFVQPLRHRIAPFIQNKSEKFAAGLFDGALRIYDLIAARAPGLNDNHHPINIRRQHRCVARFV